MSKEDIKKHEFKKGQSGNPKGRPPVLPVLKDGVAKMLSEEQKDMTGLDALLRKLFTMGMSGNVRAIQELLDRGYGKASQFVEHSGEIKTQQKLTDEQINKLLDKL